MTSSYAHDDDPETQEWLRRVQLVPDHVKVASNLKAAEFHWHFVQGIKAVDSELYVPGSLSLLAGIEASIRWTLIRLRQSDMPREKDLGTTLSNSLLRKAHAEGMPVDLLIFFGETDFWTNLNCRKPDVQIVSLRHDLAHGNVQSFINRELGDDMAFFTPECLRPLALELRRMAIDWSVALSTFREARIK